MMKPVNKLLLVLFCSTLLSCTGGRLTNTENLCQIFRDNDDMYDAAIAMEKRWKVPLQIPMAMMYQESHFKEDARPKRDYLLWVIPWGYVSSAYGYAQALDEAWKDYIKSTKNYGADRDDIDDALDFMGWYIRQSTKVNNLSVWDTKELYLNYHEGWGGYRRGTWKNKGWLINTAVKVEQRANRYGAQYRKCKDSLSSSWF